MPKSLTSQEFIQERQVVCVAPWPSNALKVGSVLGHVMIEIMTESFR